MSQNTTKPETHPRIIPTTEERDHFLLKVGGLVTDWELEWDRMGLIVLDDMAPVEDRPILHVGLF